jgi:hypothetical protein
MRTYSEIIDLNEYYSPYYNLLNEREDYWKSFIPTSQFYELLGLVLNSLENNGLSIWLHGAYGTGKSHATGFMKHLLYLPLDEISKVIENFHDIQIKHRLTKFRKDNTVFPVIMYGADKITNQIDFALQIEMGVRAAFKKANIQLTIKTDFDIYIDSIMNDNSTFWETIIEDTFEIHELVKSKEDLIQKLQSLDQDVFLAVRDELNRRNHTISVKDIVKWLADVSAELKKQNIATHMIIYWDEFTTILDKNKPEIFEYIQRIAEASTSSGVRLYLISHRTVLQGTQREDRHKLLGRFTDATYEMSDITTYLLMSNAIQKKDIESWMLYRNQKNDIISDVISKIGQYEAEEALEDIRNLFPIHPYTAYVSSYIARVMGSTERSIFNFLNDQATGFKYFIDNFPGSDRIEYLTVDYVFDFFQKVFEDQNDPFFTSVLQRLKYNNDILKKENKLYPALFKTLLMMNIAHHKINVGNENNRLVIPNGENLNSALSGTHLEDNIESFLNFIDTKKIIIKDHSNRYIVDAANYDMSEIEDWKAKNRGKYKSVEEIFVHDYQTKLFRQLLNSHRRQDVTKVILLDAENTDSQIKRKVTKDFEDNYYLNIIFLIARNLDHYSQIINDIPNILKDIDVPVCFILMDKLFVDTDMERYLDFKSMAEVAHNKHNAEAEEAARKNTEGHLTQWINDAIKNSSVKWFVKDKDDEVINSSCIYSELSKILNSKVSQIIFYHSFDTLYPKLSVETAWKSSLTMKTAENFLLADNFLDLSQKMRAAPMNVTLEILSDMGGSLLVKDNLKIERNIAEHPLIIIRQKLENRIGSKDVVNLIDVMEFLFKSPFGFYPNHVFLATIGFVMRKYRGKFYGVSTGEQITEIKLLEMIDKVFRYFCQNRFNFKNEVNVRIGSENETRLVKLLEEMFGLPACDSIIDTRLKLADWLKTNLKIPLWIMVYSTDVNEDIQLCLKVIGSKILNLSSDSTLSPKDLTDIYDMIFESKDEIMNCLSNVDENVRKEIFGNFIKKELDIIYSFYQDNLYPELMYFLQVNLQTDPIYWGENDVISTIQKWYINRITPPPPREAGEEPIDDKHPPRTGGRTHISKQIVIFLIENYQGDFKEVLISLLNINDEFIEDIYKLLNGESYE